MNEFIHLPFRSIDRKFDAVYACVYYFANSLGGCQCAIGSQIDIGITDIFCHFYILGQLRNDERFTCRIKTDFPCSKFICLTEHAFRHLGIHSADLPLHLLMCAEQAFMVAGVGQFQQEIGIRKRRL